MNNTPIKPINIALDQKVQIEAQRFAAQQNTIQQGKQVYLNALAVYAVHTYLRWLRIDSELQTSDSWQPGIQALSNTADLLIPDIGRIECCPVLPQDSYLTIAPQATEDRIGYVAVKFQESLKQAQLVGFFPSVTPSQASQQIPLTKLQSLESLIIRISPPIAQEVTKPVSPTTVNLSQWWTEIFEPGWLSLETLFRKNVFNVNFALRGEATLQKQEADNSTLPVNIRRGKIINLGVKPNNNFVALIVTCTPTVTAEIDILIQVYPGGERIYLPPTLELKVWDETETLIPELQVKARNTDNYIQLFFAGDIGEKFSVILTLNGISVTENFQI